MSEVKNKQAISLTVPIIYGSLVLFVVAFALLGQLRMFRGGETPAYIDLTKGEAYARLGFDENDISADPKPENGWVDYYADGAPHGSKALTIQNTGLPGLPKLTPLSPFKKINLVEFTTLIKVDIPPEQMYYIQSNSDNPTALYMAAIANNWQVYLNGSLVKSEWYVDEDGSITLDSARNGIYIPVKSSLFREGENYFAFRIIGDANATDIGFWLSSPFYVEEFDALFSQHADVVLIILVGIYIMVSVYHLMIFLLNRADKVNLVYGLASLFSAVYGLVRTQYIYIVIRDSFVTSHLEVTALYFMVPLFAIFLDMVGHNGKISLISKIYAAFCVFLAVLGLFAAQQFVMYWEVTTIVYILYLYFYRVLYSLIKASKKNGFAYMLSETLHGTSAIAATVIIVCAISDLLNQLLFDTMVGFTNYALLMFTMGMSFTLARQSAKLQSRIGNLNVILEQTNEHLEESVRERTLTLEKERRDAELARQEAEVQRRKAERANESKSNFLAKMSHEIRTPMNAIIGMSELVLRENSSPAIRENTISIKHAGINLLAIINDILDFSKIESGKMDIAAAEYQFSSLINDVISIIRVRLTEKPIVFAVNIDGKLPNTVIGDEVRIRQILLNLLTNAVKYTNEGSITFKISGDWKADKSEVRMFFEITDSGIGIKEDDLGKLFDDFTQFDEKRNKFVEGTGLGLAITHKLCTAMGGDVIVSSIYGVGSTFTAIVPQKVAVYKPIAEVSEPEKCKILIYQTNEIYTRSISESLINLGVGYDIITNDDDLIAALRSGEYNYVFINFIMFDKVARLLSDENFRGTIVQLSKFGTSSKDKNVRTIAMPVHSISIANILNNAEDTQYNSDENINIRFIAPTAQILIVDDIATNLKVAEGLMSPYNMHISTCMSGIEAIRLAKENSYDIILMDHMMPEMNGIEAVRIIRETDGAVPIIALTANAVSGMREMFLENGFNDYLAKPIEMVKLSEIMEKWIPPSKRVKAAVQMNTHISESDIVISGIDVQRGISMSGGSESNYREILSLFCRDADERLTVLGVIPGAENMQLFITQVHALKSASASIGAQKLSEQAAYLEEAGNNGNFLAIRNELGAFRDNLSHLVKDIRGAIAASAPEMPESSGLDDELLLKLKNALESDDIEVADEILDELTSKTYGEEIRKPLSAISDFVLMGSYEKAADALKELIK
ncbi:MAG: response regulator [Oscillospiraceae bacterium]|jgi:signal transduction histidine kinase/CheY-like chemotaxis protein|nr:response regulator [Oscillospiraceae bacterium]